MPVALRSTSSKAEAKYNVTTDFPSHGLHAAAATGNVGLVEYALSRGQPVNSVLDGVLPLHAACSGGTPLHNVVVKKLIECGADVNAPRLPRRYSNEKNRDNSQPIVGASGSTPLHFAAANGNTGTVQILLKSGAVADRPDKHGVTPELLARRNGWLECADVLRDWTNSQNRDLLEKQGSFNATATSADGETPVKSKRLQMKQSMEHALHILKPSTSQLFESSKQATPPSPQDQSGVALGQYTFDPSSPVELDPSTRRPSLPQATMLPPSNRKSSTHSTRRPSSAGSDAERSSSSITGSFSRNPPPTMRKGSKVSLLNLFRKSQQQACDSPERSTTSLPSDISPTASKSIPIANKNNKERSVGESSSPRRAVDLHNALALAHQSGQYDFDAATQRGSTASLGSRRPSNTFRPGHLRDRSGSRGSGSAANAVNRGGTVFEDDVLVISGTELSSTPPKRPPGPGILRTHQRSTSNGMGTGAARSLRFDSSSSSGRYRQDSDSSRLRGSNSTSSLIQSAAPESHITPPTSAPATSPDFVVNTDDGDDGEEEYGQILSAYAPTLRISRTESMTGSESSFSPVIDSATSVDPDGPSNFPFSISQPPPMLVEGPTPERRKDLRDRGASFSSMDTNPGMSSGESAAGTTRSPLVSPQNSGGLPSCDDMMPTVSSLSAELNSWSFAGRRPRTPMEIDIRDISSHAEAEELVQRTQQCILDMDHGSDDDDDETPGPDWMPLSARLAAYGKSLAVERKFREERDRQLSESSPTMDSPTSPQAPPSFSPPTSSPLAKPTSLPTPSTALGRQSSLRNAPRPVKKVSGPRRPNTSSGAPEREGANPADLFFAERRTHSLTPTTQATPSRPSPTIPARRSMGDAYDDSDDEYQHPIVRSHTPKPYYYEDTGLYRVATTPAEHTARSSHKLARMGFSKNPEPPVRSGGRFGAIKSFFKGKP